MAKFTEKDDKLYIDGKKVLKGWESFSGWYWFATELDRTQDSVINGKTYKNDKIWFGYVQGQEEEWGYFSEAELKSLGNRVWKLPSKSLSYSGRRN